VSAEPIPAQPLDSATTLQSRAAWRDPKRYAWLLGLFVPTLPFLAWGLVHVTGLGVFWFYGPVLVFGIFPPLDLARGMDESNPPDDMIKWLEQDRYYRWCTYLYLPIQYAGLVFACWLWAHGHLGTVDNIGLAVTVAMVSGIAINTAHELGHKRASLERWLSKVATTCAWPRLRTRQARAWARASTRSCRAR
jgi:alkane 1-monooxygenase